MAVVRGGRPDGALVHAIQAAAVPAAAAGARLVLILVLVHVAPAAAGGAQGAARIRSADFRVYPTNILDIQSFRTSLYIIYYEYSHTVM